MASTPNATAWPVGLSHHCAMAPTPDIARKATVASKRLFSSRPRRAMRAVANTNAASASEGTGEWKGALTRAASSKAGTMVVIAAAALLGGRAAAVVVVARRLEVGWKVVKAGLVDGDLGLG
jgi:hypothetical protein